MNLRSSTTALAMLLLSSVVGCAAGSEKEATESSADELRGGSQSFNQPAVGKLMVERGNMIGMCTASLIGPRAILTAAHCVGPVESAWLPSGGSQARPIVRVKGTFTIELSATSHKDFVVDAFVAFGNVAGTNDIAVAHLATPVPASLATPLTLSDTKPKTGEVVTLFGYGCNSADGIADTESTGTKQELETSYGASKQVVCRGDSGGPAIYHGARGDIFRVISAIMEKRKVLIFGGGRADDAYGDVVKHRELIRFYATSFTTLDTLPSSPRAY